MFRDRAFTCVFAIMLVAALGLNTAVQGMHLHFAKERVELRRDLDRLPSQLGPWLKVIDTQLDPETEHTLGTRQYIQRDYVDTRRLSPAELTQAKTLLGSARDQFVQQLRGRDPAAVVTLHVAYYTGMVDTVAHVPERCYVGGGFNPENPAIVSLPAFPNTPGRDPNVTFKYVEFRDRGRPMLGTRNVAYCFQVNGKYEYDSIQGVRFRLQNIFEKYGYYAKIELCTFQGSGQTEQAKATMADLLSHAMPEIEKCLPDWHAVTGEDAPLNRGQ